MSFDDLNFEHVSFGQFDLTERLAAGTVKKDHSIARPEPQHLQGVKGLVAGDPDERGVEIVHMKPSNGHREHDPCAARG